MRSQSLLAFSFLTVAGCSLGRVSSQGEALAVSPDLVITQVYGGGGNSMSVYKNDYIVLFNTGASAASLNGLSLYYQAASSMTGTWSDSTALPDVSIDPGRSYLVQETAGTGGTTDLPSPDYTPTAGQGILSISATGGEVALASSDTKPGTDPSTWIDMVGWGGAKIFEGASAASTTNTTAIVRTSSCVDTGHNDADFTAQTAAPVNGGSPIVICPHADGGVDMDVDMTKGPDMVVNDAGPYTAALNEVKWNPAGKDDGQEFIELIGTGTLPPHTFVVSVSGDAEAKVSTVGQINYAYDVSATPFGSNGLILIKAAATTFPGIPGATNVLDDASLNTAKLGNYTESTMLIQVNDPVATPIVTGGTIPSSTAYTILDSLAVRDPAETDGGTAGVLDPVYGTAVLEACASEVPGKSYPPSGASRIVGNTTVESATAWYAGQAYGASTDQYLSNVADCSTSSSPPQTWSMSPGLPNNMPTEPAPDLRNAPIIDLSAPSDDLATTSSDDLAAVTVDFARTNDGGSTIKPGSNIGGSGCATGGRGSVGSVSAALLIGLALLLRSRRRTV